VCSYDAVSLFYLELYVKLSIYLSIYVTNKTEDTRYSSDGVKYENDERQKGLRKEQANKERGTWTLMYKQDRCVNHDSYAK
jgi:hypothetical protein